MNCQKQLATLFVSASACVSLALIFPAVSVAQERGAVLLDTYTYAFFSTPDPCNGFGRLVRLNQNMQPVAMYKPPIDTEELLSHMEDKSGDEFPKECVNWWRKVAPDKSLLEKHKPDATLVVIRPAFMYCDYCPSLYKDISASKSQRILFLSATPTMSTQEPVFINGLDMSKIHPPQPFELAPRIVVETAEKAKAAYIKEHGSLPPKIGM